MIRQPEPHPPAAQPVRIKAAQAKRGTQRSTLAVEITVALCVKLLLLFALYQIWFAHPQSRQLTGRGVETALFGPVAGPSPRAERPDDSRP